jgi:hypothetical protein
MREKLEESCVAVYGMGYEQGLSDTLLVVDPGKRYILVYFNVKGTYTVIS